MGLICTFYGQSINPIPTQAQPKDHIPLGITNFPLGSLHGICDQIATFQALCAGLRCIDTTRFSTLKKSAAAKDPLLPVAKRYFNQMYKKGHSIPFIFSPQELYKNLEKNTDCFDSWLTEHNDYIHVFEQVIDQKITVNQKDLENYITSILPSYQKPPIIVIQLKSKARVNIDHATTIESIMQDRPFNICSSCTVKIENGTTQQYRLVGAVQKHNYCLVSSNRYNIRKLLVYLFRFSFNESVLARIAADFLLPSKGIVRRFNLVWKTHFDAYVNYDNRWYVMDDQTRWKVSDIQTTSGLTQETDKTAQALLQSYPGIPTLLVYAPVENSIETHENVTEKTSGKEYAIHLTRETPVPAKRSAIMYLLGCGLIDGIMSWDLLKLTSIALNRLGFYSHMPSNKITLGISGLVSCASIAYHIRHILPMYQKSRTYHSGIADLGPRSPLI